MFLCNFRYLVQRGDCTFTRARPIIICLDEQYGEYSICHQWLDKKECAVSRHWPGKPPISKPTKAKPMKRPKHILRHPRQFPAANATLASIENQSAPSNFSSAAPTEETASTSSSTSPLNEQPLVQGARAAWLQSLRTSQQSAEKTQSQLMQNPPPPIHRKPRSGNLLSSPPTVRPP